MRLLVPTQRLVQLLLTPIHTDFPYVNLRQEIESTLVYVIENVSNTSRVHGKLIIRDTEGHHHRMLRLIHA